MALQLIAACRETEMWLLCNHAWLPCSFIDLLIASQMPLKPYKDMTQTYICSPSRWLRDPNETTCKSGEHQQATASWRWDLGFDPLPFADPFPLSRPQKYRRDTKERETLKSHFITLSCFHVYSTRDNWEDLLKRGSLCTCKVIPSMPNKRL